MKSYSYESICECDKHILGFTEGDEKWSMRHVI